MLFVDKFAYNPGQGNFPAIYIRDPSSGVQYELEELEEVKSGCLLSLNIERALHRPFCGRLKLTTIQRSTRSKNTSTRRSPISHQSSATSAKLSATQTNAHPSSRPYPSHPNHPSTPSPRPDRQTHNSAASRAVSRVWSATHRPSSLVPLFNRR